MGFENHAAFPRFTAIDRADERVPADSRDIGKFAVSEVLRFSMKSDEVIQGVEQGHEGLPRPGGVMSRYRSPR